MADNIRDFGARERTFDQYSDSVADNFGADDETLAAGLETVDQRYADSPTGRDRDRPHEAVVNKDEKGRVTEINAEYLDMMLEQYLEAVLKAEQELEERKCSGGWLGRVGRFFNETDLGKILKTGTKVIGGTALSVAATFGSFGIASPLALAMASRTAVDGVGEFIQYFGIGRRFRGERGALAGIRDAKNRRAQEVLKLMDIRNRIHNDNDKPQNLSDNIEGATGSRINLAEELTKIIETLDAIEEEIGQGESNLGRIRSIGRTIRLVANTVVSGGIVADHLAHGGLTMGVQHFSGSGHEVKMFSNGVHFLYNNADEISAEAIKHGALHTIPHFAAAHDTVLGVGHTLGSNAPWGEIYGVGMGMVGGLVGSAAYEMSDAAKQAGIAANPGARPVFTLRGRTESGNASHEISDSGPTDSEAVTEDKKGTLEAIRGELSAGSVWEWTSDRGKQLVEIVSVDGDKLKFYYIDDDGNRTSGINEYSGDAKIRDGKKVASSVEELKDGKSVDEAVKKLAADYHVKVPQTGEKWKVRAGTTDPKLKPEGVFASLGEIVLSPGDTIEIKQLGNKKKTASVIVRDANGKEKEEKIVSTESLIKNCVPPRSGIIETSGSGGAEGEEGEMSEHAKILEEINKRIVEQRLGPSGLAKDQVWVVKGNWYVIGDINEEAGTIMLWTGALAAGHVPEDNTLKDRKNFKIKSFEQMQSLIENATKASYRDVIKEKQQQQKKNKGGGGGTP